MDSDGPVVDEACDEHVETSSILPFLRNLVFSLFNLIGLHIFGQSKSSYTHQSDYFVTTED